MITVIEGADGTGKTTLARAFARVGFHYVHNGPPAPGADMFENYTQQLLKAQALSVNVVFDRFHLGEHVYGKYVRGQAGLDIEQLRLINRLLFSQGGVLIICHVLDQVVVANWKKRAEAEAEYVKSADTLVKINRAYGHLAQRVFHHDGTYTYDYTFHRELLPFVHDIVGGSDDRALPPGVIGRPAGRFLFVGDRVKAGAPYDLAFYSNKRSSHFLNQCLWDAGYCEPELMFTNSRAVNGRIRDLRLLRSSMPAATIVTLGQKADRLCAQQDVPHLTAPHPQYVKRFKSKQRDEYVALLRSFRPTEER